MKATFSWFSIMDNSHNKCIVAGDQADNLVYHQDKGGPQGTSVKLRGNAQWKFVPVSGDTGYYMIFDKQNVEKAIVSGDNYDGKVYHQNPKDRDNAKWRLEDVDGQGIHFRIYDKKHNKAIVAGNVADNCVYHQEPGERDNAVWKIVLEDQSANSIGPSELLISEKIERTEFHYDQKKEFNESDTVFSVGNYENRTSLPQSLTMGENKRLSCTENWAFTDEISNSFFLKVSATVEQSVGVEKISETKASITAESGFETHKTHSATKGGEKQVEYGFTLERPINCAPQKITHYKAFTKRTNANVPFTITSKKTFGDGITKDVTYTGIWTGSVFSETKTEVWETNLP